MIESIRKIVAESLELKQKFFSSNEELLVRAADEISRALARGNKVLLYGNGGSASNSQHLAAEWVGRFQRKRDALPAIALTTDTSILTAVGNDFGFDQIFSRQMRALGRAGDVSVGFSTSGNSPNVLAANDAAREMGLVTVGLTGCDGGKLGAGVQYHVNVPCESPARVQEVHIMIGHILCALSESTLKGL